MAVSREFRKEVVERYQCIDAFKWLLQASKGIMFRPSQDTLFFRNVISFDALFPRTPLRVDNTYQDSVEQVQSVRFVAVQSNVGFWSYDHLVRFRQLEVIDFHYTVAETPRTAKQR